MSQRCGELLQHEACEGDEIVATAEELVDIDGDSGSVNPQVGRKLLAICDLRSREAGFVLLGAGELAHLQGSLRAYAFALTPQEFVESLEGDGWWVGLSWLAVAKAFSAQESLFVEQAWQYPAGFMKPLIEVALLQHEVGAPRARSADRLCSVLFGDDRTWFLKKLRKCKRKKCRYCSQRIEVEEEHRVPVEVLEAERSSSGSDALQESDLQFMCISCYDDWYSFDSWNEPSDEESDGSHDCCSSDATDTMGCYVLGDETADSE